MTLRPSVKWSLFLTGGEDPPGLIIIYSLRWSLDRRTSLQDLPEKNKKYCNDQITHITNDKKL